MPISAIRCRWSGSMLSAIRLVFANDYGQNRLCFNEGAGTFIDATAGRMPVGRDYTRAVALGDVDGGVVVDDDDRIRH